MFNRTTKGDALAAVADIVRTLTFDEMTTFATSISVDPAKLNKWAKDYGTFVLEAPAGPTVAEAHKAV